jgi:hypothetical protein
VVKYSQTKMSLNAPDASAKDDVDGYSGVILSSQEEIYQLRDTAGRWLQPDADPKFFLASVSKGWKARVVAVRRAGELVGIVYAKERIIAGIPTGIVYADGSLADITVADPLDRQNVFRIAVDTLLRFPTIRGVRVRILRSGCEVAAIRELIASRPLDTHYSRIKHGSPSIWKHHAHLLLPDKYEEQFLMGLGGATRHNFRYYRRRFEASGHSFIDHLSMEELRSGALALGPKSTFTGRPLEVEQALNVVAAARQPLVIGLKHHNGEWLSVIGGWYRPRGAVLLVQFNNNRDFGPDSLSIVLRAYLIEMLIRQGLEELVIWGGTGPPLSRYVRYVPTICVSLDVRRYSWRMARFFVSTAGPWLPRRFASVAQWVAPL